MTLILLVGFVEGSRGVSFKYYLLKTLIRNAPASLHPNCKIDMSSRSEARDLLRLIPFTFSYLFKKS
jgi:hypothetical protein